MKVTLKDSLQSLVVTGKFKGMGVHGSLLADECMCSFYAARQELVQGTEGAVALVQQPCSTPAESTSWWGKSVQNIYMPWPKPISHKAPSHTLEVELSCAKVCSPSLAGGGGRGAELKMESDFRIHHFSQAQNHNVSGNIRKIISSPPLPFSAFSGRHIYFILIWVNRLMYK